MSLRELTGAACAPGGPYEPSMPESRSRSRDIGSREKHIRLERSAWT